MRVDHLRARFQGWADLIKKVVTLDSRGDPCRNAAAAFHSVLQKLFKQWCSTIQHRAIDGFDNAAKGPDATSKDFLCWRANRCMCGSIGKMSLKLRNNIHASMKRMYRTKADRA
eukprot:6478222-Pyramimonas_sp.AAC.1